MEDARHIALEMLQTFCRKAAWGYSEELDFYRLLWEVHGGMLSHGRGAVHEVLYGLMDDRDVTPYNAPSVFAERLQHRGESGNDFDEWFQRAISGG